MVDQTIRVFVGCGSAKRFDDEIEDCKETLHSLLDETRVPDATVEAFLDDEQPLDEFLAAVRSCVPPETYDAAQDAAQRLHDYRTREVPASTLYTSTYFDFKEDFSDLYGDDWFIISAEHHVLHPETEITTYEKNLSEMTTAEINAWGAETTTQLRNLSWEETDVLVVLLGKTYLNPIKDTLSELPVTVVQPFETTSGIGEQMGLLKDRITAKKHNPDAELLPDGGTKTTQLEKPVSAQQQLTEFK